MEILKIFNDENVAEEEAINFRRRKAVRGVIMDNEGKVAIIHAKNNNYYELPGGGVEEGESLEQGLMRECLEEAGCRIEIVRELGKTIEMRKRANLVNESFGYLVKVDGEKGHPKLTPDEIGEGMEVLWLFPDEAQESLEKSDTSKDLYDRYVMERDKCFLKEALFKL